MIVSLLLLLGGGAFWYDQRASETSTVAENGWPWSVSSPIARLHPLVPLQLQL
jgi:hypothetical protein